MIQGLAMNVHLKVSSIFPRKTICVRCPEKQSCNQATILHAHLHIPDSASRFAMPFSLPLPPSLIAAAASYSFPACPHRVLFICNPTCRRLRPTTQGLPISHVQCWSWLVHAQWYYCTASLSHLRTMLPESISLPNGPITQP